MPKTLLIGNFGDHNLGDELILSAALEDYPNAIVMTSDPSFSKTFTEHDFETVPFPPVGIRSWWHFLTKPGYGQALAMLRHQKIEQVVFPGGGLFAIKFKACFLWWRVFRFVKKCFPEAEIRLEHQGVDQGLVFMSKKCVQYVFSKSNFVSVRDTSSGKALGAVNHEVCNDRVFDYLKNLNSPACPEPDEKLIIVNALSPFDVDGVAAQYPDHDLVFVPFALSDLSVLPDDFSYEIIFPKTKTELLDLMSRAEMLIGERFHSIVCGAHFCGSDKTFTLKKPYSEKVKSFCVKEGIQKFKK